MKRTKYKWYLLSGFTAVGLLLAGCGNQSTPEGEDPKQGTEAVAETEAAAETEEVPTTDQNEIEQLAVEIGQTQEKELKDEEGNVLLTYKVNDVKVTIPGNPEAQEAVNSFFEDRINSFMDTVNEYKEMSAEDLKMRKEMAETQTEEEQEADKEILENWPGYGIGMEMSLKRVDERMISIAEDYYEFTGGAHPNAFRCAYNFDTKTGKLMTLKDVASGLDEIQTETKAYLSKMLPESEYAEMLFDDYEKDLEDILTDTTWYVDEEGFHIICNEYIITPHAAGILEFVMPFDEADVIKSEYKPMDDLSE